MTCWSLAFVRWLTSRACVKISSLVCTTYCRSNKLIFMKTFSISTRILPSFTLVHELLSSWTIFAHLFCVGCVRCHLHGKWTALWCFEPCWIRAGIILWAKMTMLKKLQYCSSNEACLKSLFGIPYTLNFSSMLFRCQNLNVTTLKKLFHQRSNTTLSTGLVQGLDLICLNENDASLF